MEVALPGSVHFAPQRRPRRTVDLAPDAGVNRFVRLRFKIRKTV